MSLPFVDGQVPIAADFNDFLAQVQDLAAAAGGYSESSHGAATAAASSASDAADSAEAAAASAAAAAEAAAAGGGGGTGTSYPDPAHEYFGPSGVVVEQAAGMISGDPFIVWDGAKYIMYFFRSSPAVTCRYRTATSLEGPWSASTQIASLNGYHKLAVLVDASGAPVLVSGTYHGYAVAFNGASLASKEIYHFTTASLTGAWTLTGKVVAKGLAGSKDAYNTDTPCAVYAEGMVHLWYMGAPTGALATYGLAERMLRATAPAPSGPFTKDYTDVLLPATSAAWDYGWMGGVQIRARPSGGYLMIYNAGSTRPSTAGDEPAASAIGMAYANALSGPWTKDAANPYLEISGTPSDALEKINVWRGHLSWDAAAKRWYLFYNAGSGTETITFARQGVYDYFYSSQGNPYEVQALTTSKVAIYNSRVNLVPGVYRVHAAINVIGDGGSDSTPKLDVDTSFRINGTNYKLAGRDFIGSYPYENRDLIVNHVFALGVRGYVDLAIQVTGGTPVALSKARRLRINVTKI